MYAPSFFIHDFDSTECADCGIDILPDEVAFEEDDEYYCIYCYEDMYDYSKNPLALTIPSLVVPSFW